MHVFSDPTSRAYARLTGLFYLTIAFAGGFAILWVPSQLQVPGDAQATFANIVARKSLYLWGIGGEVLILIAEIMATAMLYFMFKRVNPTLSFAAALARLSMVGVMAAMLFFHFAALALADPGSTLTSFTEAQRLDLAGLMLATHDAGVWVWQIFFTVHLAILGQLVARSGVFPRLLGHAMTFGAVGYTLDTLSAFVFPGNAALAGVTGVFLAVVTFAEVGFALWLIFRGPRPAPNAAAPAFA